MMDLTNGQSLMMDIAEMARGNFRTVVFVLGRQSGKMVMGEDLIVREIERLREGHDPVSYSGDELITHFSLSGEMARVFSEHFEKRLSKENIGFEKRGLPGSVRFIIEGKKTDGSPSRIVVDVTSIKNDIGIGKEDGVLMIYDDIPGPLDSMLSVTNRPGYRIVFRTEHEDGDCRSGVLVIQAHQRDMIPSLIA